MPPWRPWRPWRLARPKPAPEYLGLGKVCGQGKVDPAKVNVFFTTPVYFDHNWTVHADMPAPPREKLTQAFLRLDRSNAEGKEILDQQHATRFIATKAGNCKGIERAARSAGLLK